MFGLFVVLLMNEIFSILSVPPEYCLIPLNESDCGSLATPVFSYYKPGSRCEISMWRGCPSLNRFPNEYECSHHCIGRNWRTDAMSTDSDLSLDPSKYCSQKLNTEDCSSNMQVVYTYIPEMEKCVWDIWYQCETSNKFLDDASCHATCTGLLPSKNDNEDELLLEWISKISKLQKDVIQSISDIIDELQQSVNIDEKEDTKMKFVEEIHYHEPDWTQQSEESKAPTSYTVDSDDEEIRLSKPNKSFISDVVFPGHIDRI